MHRFDLCLAWNWEYDAGFVQLLEAALTRRGLSLFQVTSENLQAVLADLDSGQLQFAAFFDRASDSDESFQPLADWARSAGLVRINPQEQTRWAWDKATMHLEFLSAGLDIPYTLLLSPYIEQPLLPPLDLGLLGGTFVIKPASTGGGVGVVLEASSLEQVSNARQQFPTEKYLLQAHVTPRILDERQAWFRVLVCDGAVYPCWWDTHTHQYLRVSAEEKARFALRPLYEISRRISGISCLDLFSTEIALTDAGRFLVVDYVNDPVDLRLQTAAADGVPDAIVGNITGRLARLLDGRSS